MTEFARDVAPHVDRVTLSVFPLIRPRLAEVVAGAGITGNTRVLVLSAGPLLAGPVAAGDLHPILRYMPWPDFVAALDEHVAQGLFERVEDGRYGLTEAGRRFAAEVQTAQGVAANGQWASVADVVDRLLPLAERLTAAAWETAGPAYAAVANGRDPAQASPAHQLWSRVTALRFHRADAHAAAWAAAGLSAEQIVALTEGPEREKIEADTNQRAGAPYGALTAAERTAWLEGLAALPT